MNEVPVWRVSKWPFLAFSVLLLAAASAIICKAERPISETEVILVVGCVALGSVLGCLPYVLDYRAAGKMLEIGAVGTVAERLQDLQKYTEQISAATGRWAQVQEATRGHAEKTVQGAREIAEQMTTEIREFNEFQSKLNDTEKAALRLEVEKFRRAEAEWLQVLARILDHIFALHNAAARSGNAELADQIANFQNACRDAARRVGLAPFSVAPDEKFDARLHRAHGLEKPPAEARVAETIAPGMTYQGRLVRPALVRLQEPNSAAPGTAPENGTAKTEPAEPDPLALDAEK